MSKQKEDTDRDTQAGGVAGAGDGDYGDVSHQCQRARA